jgi:possible TPR repeat-containing protein
MDILDLIKNNRLYDALILTVGLIEKSEHEKMDVKALIEAYHLSHTLDNDPYFSDMIKTGILKILYNSTQNDIQVETLIELAASVSEGADESRSVAYFEQYLAEFLCQAAHTLHDRGDDATAYRCLTVLASLDVDIQTDYMLLENELKQQLQLRADYSVFSQKKRGGGSGNLLQPLMESSQALLRLCERRLPIQRRFRVDILLEFPVVWCKVKPLYEAMMKDPFFDCRLIAINMQDFMWDSQTQYPEFIRFLNDQDLPFVPEAAYDLDERRPDALIYTNPYDGHHQRFSVNLVNSKGIRIVYLPYSIPFFVDQNTRGFLYDGPIHNFAWKIYVRAQREKRRYGMHCRAGNAHVEVAGAPLIEYLREQKELIQPDCSFKKTFLWGVDYGFDNHTATFLSYAYALVEYFLARPQLALIVRPHPLFNGSVVKRGFLTEEEVRAFYEKCAAAPNIFLDFSGDLTPSFCKSDALISDISSILVEYLAMRRPILYLNTEDTRDHREYHEDDSDVLVHYYSGDSFEHIVDFIEMVVAEKDPMREERESVMDQYFYRPQENAGENIKEMLKDALKNL